MRIDKALAEKFGSRSKAAAAINKGLVTVNGKSVTVSYNLKDTDTVAISETETAFVSAGGYKLEKALNDFNVDVSGMVFADIGASTGGFTDCLFKRGVKKVYCIDVGESQLDKSLLNKNIVVIDGFNARELNKSLFKEALDGIVIDVSFISLTYILGAAAEVLEEGKRVFALIKPQFECGKKNVGKNGIVKSAEAHKQAIVKVLDHAKSVGLFPQKLTNAPVIQGKNMEYVVYLEKGGADCNNEDMLKSVKM